MQATTRSVVDILVPYLTIRGPLQDSDVNPSEPMCSATTHNGSGCGSVQTHRLKPPSMMASPAAAKRRRAYRKKSSSLRERKRSQDGGYERRSSASNVECSVSKEVLYVWLCMFMSPHIASQLFSCMLSFLFL